VGGSLQTGYDKVLGVLCCTVLAADAWHAGNSVFCCCLPACLQSALAPLTGTGYDAAHKSNLESLLGVSLGCCTQHGTAHHHPHTLSPALQRKPYAFYVSVCAYPENSPAQHTCHQLCNLPRMLHLLLLLLLPPCVFKHHTPVPVRPSGPRYCLSQADQSCSSQVCCGRLPSAGQPSYAGQTAGWTGLQVGMWRRAGPPHCVQFLPTYFHTEHGAGCSRGCPASCRSQALNHVSLYVAEGVCARGGSAAGPALCAIREIKADTQSKAQAWPEAALHFCTRPCVLG
jgi:hypothetical protein